MYYAYKFFDHKHVLDGHLKLSYGVQYKSVFVCQLRGTTSRTVKEEMDQMKKVMQEMKENMRRANPIEDLVHKTDSPFTASIN